MSDYIYCYKYLPFEPEGALKVITESTIKFAEASEFNDPFDCVPYIDPNQITYESIKPVLKLANISPAQRISERLKHKRTLQRLIKSGDYLKEMNRDFGICCLSRCGLNPLMWAHYAKDHKGFVVEFKIPYSDHSVIDSHDHYLVPLPVNYEDTRPQLDVPTLETDQAKEAVLTKSVDWQYEQEERVLSYQRGPGIHSVSPELLCTVVAGMRMNPYYYDALESAINNHNKQHNKNVRLYQAEAHPREYRIIVRDHPRLDPTMKTKSSN